MGFRKWGFNMELIIIAESSLVMKWVLEKLSRQYLFPIFTKEIGLF
jgi:hypothetical protein